MPSPIVVEKIPEPLRPLLSALCTVAGDLSVHIARGPLAGAMAATVGSNHGGDTQKALDVIADDAFAAALSDADTRWYASEERPDVTRITPDGRWALAIDPLDGSSNIDVNVSIGTIFSVFDARDDGLSSFLRPASEQVAAGYFIYGPHTALLLTCGSGVLHFVRDPAEGRFMPVAEPVRIPQTSQEFAINASNYRHWPQPVRAYIDDCIAGTDGPYPHNFNMRWVASLVAEAHRILSRGGVFLYPGDDRPGYEEGRLRMVYECAPIAMLIEQAGGQATTGGERLLRRSASSLHARTPMIFGSEENVAHIATYHRLPDHE